MKIKQVLKRIYFNFPHSDVYMFHHVEEKPPVPMSGCKLASDDFYDFVDRHTKGISIGDLLAGRIPKCGRVAYTFDDGLEDVYRVAYPYLKKYNIPFTVFILTDFLDQPGYMTTEQLLELNQDPLVTIGAHGTEHRILTKISGGEQREEIFESKAQLEKIINKEVSIFAYSHGQYDKNILSLVREAGYQYAFSVRERPFNVSEKLNEFALPRYNVDSNTIAKYKKENKNEPV